MPSGAKKRKAAKKKKGTHPSNSPNPSFAPSHDGGDVKHQDDRQSDVGEASSTSQDPSHQDLLTEGEEEKDENKNASSNPPPVKGGNKHDIVVERNAPSTKGEFKIGDKIGGKFEHEETEQKSYDGGSSGSSSSRSNSSSDDESHSVKSSRHAAVDAAQVSAKLDHSLHEENIESVPAITVQEASEVFVDCEPTVVSGEGMEVDTNSPEKSSVVEGNGEKKGSVGGQVSVSLENPEIKYDPKICAAEETDERLSLSYNAPISTHDNRADFEKDTGVTEPLLVPPPRSAQTTSWKGCCGLFELFTGSDR